MTTQSTSKTSASSPVAHLAALRRLSNIPELELIELREELEEAHHELNTLAEYISATSEWYDAHHRRGARTFTDYQPPAEDDNWIAYLTSEFENPELPPAADLDNWTAYLTSDYRTSPRPLETSVGHPPQRFEGHRHNGLHRRSVNPSQDRQETLSLADA